MSSETQRDDIIDLMREIATLKESRDDLLKACEAVVKAFAKEWWTEAVAGEMSKVRAAIAKAKTPQPQEVRK